MFFSSHTDCLAVGFLALTSAVASGATSALASAVTFGAPASCLATGCTSAARYNLMFGNMQNIIQGRLEFGFYFAVRTAYSRMAVTAVAVATLRRAAKRSPQRATFGAKLGRFCFNGLDVRCALELRLADAFGARLENRHARVQGLNCLSEFGYLPRTSAAQLGTGLRSSNEQCGKRQEPHL